MRVAALILAAGQSTRFGGCKLLAPMGQQALLQCSLQLAQAVLPGAVYLVSGAWHSQLLAAQRQGMLMGASLLYNPRWRDGLSSSLVRGVEQLESDYDAILVLLADQVALTRRDLEALLRGFNGDQIVCGYYAARRGVPALFGRALFGRLKQLSGDQGAKALLHDARLPVREVAMPNAATDIDTPAQLARWLDRLRR